MSEKNSLVVKWGFIGGLAGMAFNLLMFLLNVPMASPVNYLAFFIIIGAVVFGLIAYKNAASNQQVTFGQLFGTGMLIGVVMAIVNAIWMWVYINFVDPNFLNNVMDMTREALEERNMSEAEIAQALAMTKKFVTDTAMVIRAVVGTLVLTFFSTLLASLILRTPSDQIHLDPTNNTAE